MGVVRKGLEWAVMKYLTLSGRALEVLIGTWKIFLNLCEKSRRHDQHSEHHKQC